MKGKEKYSNFTKILKLAVLVGIIIVVFTVIILLSSSDAPKAIYTKIVKPTEEKPVEMSITGDNKVQTYNTFIVDEWNGYRFKYQSDWISKNQYDEKGQFIGVLIYPNEKKNENDYIAIGNNKTNCEDFKMVKCSMAGYGLIMQPVYTYSSETNTNNVYDALIKSILDFQGKTEFDIEKINNTIKTFLTARRENKFSIAKEVLSTDFLNSYDQRSFSLSREGKIGRYEFVENRKYLDYNYYEVPTRVYAYYENEKNEIGYWDYVFKIKVLNTKYIIDEINEGKFQAK
ncbi:hypothetical protein M0R01_03470 [bacterium]|nr:hypothetical protein [bacterium]